MQILTYKRTHTGDPDSAGRFGINDCMGRVRGWSFDAVIGVGGYGPEQPRSYGIEGRINWVGLNPTRVPHPQGYGQIVTFESFVLFEEKEPFLYELAPLLARRMHEKRARVLLKSYSAAEKAEAETLLASLLGGHKAINTTTRPRRKCRKAKSTKPCRVAT
ncbi:hypothetical protein IB234_23350 [Pseudomonas sp. PDM16]|uniref:hypothetical protein n=1 Tax=Pseudomonas sp. PDM16 TaxID=2769292 RepID=UPI0017862D22|nr:hypothetical protein [Pseudomonas sp. PDM16]MBD9417512.1 hypothetical protein [Pseudomonas sp. PDM16]